ncbi:hypothetical protein QTP88_027366, partial [Uroleucon formosanum]
VTRGTCQPQSHDARLAADPTPLCVTGWWVTGDGGQWFAIRCAGGAAPPFSVSFRTHLPPSAGIAAVARSPLPQPPCHTADYPTTYKLALKSLSRGVAGGDSVHIAAAARSTCTGVLRSLPPVGLSWDVVDNFNNIEK